MSTTIRLKSLALILSTMSYQSSGMNANVCMMEKDINDARIMDKVNRNQNVGKVVEEGKTRYFLKHPALPKIIIEKCARCNQQAALKCSACKLTFYCSPLCQATDWVNHKKGCKGLQKTHLGDIEYLRNAFHAYITRTIETRQEKYLDEALSWHMQALLRIKQDKTCTDDATIAFTTIMLDGNVQFAKLIGSGICDDNQLRKKLRAAIPAAILKVKALTLENKLVPPHGVKLYGTRAFLSAQIEPDEFIPAEQWHEKRLHAIEIEEKALNDQNSSIAESEKI